MRRTRRPMTILLAVLGLLVVAPSASANTELFQKLLTDYATDLKLDACKYTEEELKQVKDVIPNDIDQYAPDFPAELDAAIERRASGACGGGGGGGGGDGAAGGGAAGGDDTPAPPPTPQSTPGVAQAPPAPAAAPTAAPAVANSAIVDAARTNADGSDAPFPLIALAILAAAMLMASAAYGAVRWWAWEPAWMVRTRHATAEAGWRASTTWAEFADFVRFGR